MLIEFLLSNSKIARGETSDCVVRAIASASGWDYDKSHKFVADEFNRKDRKGKISDLIKNVNTNFLLSFIVFLVVLPLASRRGREGSGK